MLFGIVDSSIVYDMIFSRVAGATHDWSPGRP